jgi:hypothetical protein
MWKQMVSPQARILKQRCRGYDARLTILHTKLVELGQLIQQQTAHHVSTIISPRSLLPANIHPSFLRGISTPADACSKCLNSLGTI